MKNKKHGGLRSMFFMSDGLPIGEKEKIEIVKKGKYRSVLIEGVRGILLYGTEEMAFSTSDGRVELLGRDMECTNYVSGAVGITGEISTLAFVTEGEHEKKAM